MSLHLSPYWITFGHSLTMQDNAAVLYTEEGQVGRKIQRVVQKDLSF